METAKGRGARSNATGRYEPEQHQSFDDGWTRDDAEAAPLRTTLTPEHARTIIARNDSPDIGFDRSINPYKGCEHGCIYCYARPSHAWMGLSPGLDFESRLFFKPEGPRLLEQELAARKYVCKRIHIGGNTDPYQPVERTQKITRGLLEVLQRFNQPFSIITKSNLITRDVDILGPMGRDRLASAFISITTLDRDLARTMEPRAATPARRLDAVTAGRRGRARRHRLCTRHPRLERPRAGSRAGGGRKGRGDDGHVCDPAAAAGDQGSVPGMAR